MITRLRHLGLFVLGYAVAGLGGWLATLAELPLAWVLGALLATAAMTLAGVPLRGSLRLRRTGQLIIGATVGLSMTGAVVAGLISWLPLMLATALISVFVSATFSVFFATFSRLDPVTAFFAIMPGGLSEMGNIGASVGAAPEPIALIQATRVAIVVLSIPPLMVAQGLHQPSPEIIFLPLPAIALVFGASVIASIAAHHLRLNNPWMIGSLLITAVLTAIGLLDGRMPHQLFALAQVLIGYNIGVRFRREALRKLPRAMTVGIVVILVMIATMALYGLAMHEMFGLDIATAILSSSPGGTSEMAATAQVLHLPVALITAFHVTRAVLVNGFATYYWHGLNRLGYLPALKRLTDRLVTRQ